MICCFHFIRLMKFSSSKTNNLNRNTEIVSYIWFGSKIRSHMYGIKMGSQVSEFFFSEMSCWFIVHLPPSCMIDRYIQYILFWFPWTSLCHTSHLNIPIFGFELLFEHVNKKSKCISCQRTKSVYQMAKFMACKNWPIEKKKQNNFQYIKIEVLWLMTHNDRTREREKKIDLKEKERELKENEQFKIWSLVWCRALHTARNEWKNKINWNKNVCTKCT